MVKIKGTCDVAFEAILVRPDPAVPTSPLEAAYDLTSDFLDMYWDIRKEVLDKLSGNAKFVVETAFDKAGSILLVAQKSLNDMVTADYAKITK